MLIQIWTLAAILCLQPAPEAASSAASAPASVAKELSPAEVAARSGVELCLRGLEHAALQGDKAGWLAGVDHTDPEFAKEQTYFANDLTKKRPEALALSVDGLTIADGSARGKLTFTWTMPGKRERRVAFAAGFVERDGTWLYAGEGWERHEAPGVIVLHDPGLGELAARTVEAFESVRGKVEAGFELGDSALSKHTQKIKLYGSMKHLQQSICLSYEDGLEGWNEPDESVKLLANKSSSVASLRPLLAHEYGHVATFALGPQANEMPWWIEEGVAELSREGAVGGDLPDRTVKAWAEADSLAKWDDLADFDNCPPKFHPYVYVQGHHMLGYISEQFGRHARNRWLTLMAQGKKLDEATREAFGRSFSQLDAEWRVTLPRAVVKPLEPTEKVPPREPGTVPVPGLDHPAPDEVPK
ncbi:MAG: hypothetical protein WC718_13075 [Phycisphaerales bacterium]|jgi:hypothetical protein